MKEAWFCDGARGDLRGERHVRGWIVAAVIADVLLILIQLALCLTFDGMQVSDAESYLELARYCAEENTWYPGPRDMYATYIFGNGYVNNKVMEFVGPGVGKLSADFRIGVDVMTTETTCL